MNPPLGASLTQMGYENYPEALYNVLKRVDKDLKDRNLPAMTRNVSFSSIKPSMD